jgi:hypothetical protein
VGRWRKFVFDCALSLCYSSDAGTQCPIRASACVRVRPIRLRFEAGISKRLSTFSRVFTCGSTTTTVTFNEKSGGEKVHHHIKDNDILSITPAAVTIKENSKPCHRRSLSRTAVCSWLHWLARSLNPARGCFQNTARARLPSLCLH